MLCKAENDSILRTIEGTDIKNAFERSTFSS